MLSILGLAVQAESIKIQQKQTVDFEFLISVIHNTA